MVFIFGFGNGSSIVIDLLEVIQSWVLGLAHPRYVVWGGVGLVLILRLRSV